MHLGARLGVWSQSPGKGWTSNLKLPSVRGRGQGSVHLYSIHLFPVDWGFPQWTSRLLPCFFGSGEMSFLPCWICPTWGLHCPSGGLQCSCGQKHWELVGCDWKKRPPWSEPMVFCYWTSVPPTVCPSWTPRSSIRMLISPQETGHHRLQIEGLHQGNRELAR